ncbi:MAG: TIGR01244 family sulfur transferase [Pseudomonadota bacterium]
MTRIELTAAYSVSGQLLPEDMGPLAAAGITTVVNNRPDHEVPPDLSSAALRAAAEAAGMTFVDNPVVAQALGADVGARQRDAADAAQGPVHAYCASGMRSAVAWALGEAGRMDVDDILAATDKAGFSLGGLRDILTTLNQG